MLSYFLMLFPYSIRGISLSLAFIRRVHQKEVNISKKAHQLRKCSGGWTSVVNPVVSYQIDSIYNSVA